LQEALDLSFDRLLMLMISIDFGVLEKISKYTPSCSACHVFLFLQMTFIVDKLINRTLLVSK